MAVELITTLSYGFENMSYSKIQENTNQSMEVKSPCEPDWIVEYAVFAAITFIEVLWNVLILMAIFISREKLKQNYINAFAASMIVTNIALGMLMFYTLLTYIYWFERPLNSENDSLEANRLSQYKYDQSNSVHTNIMNWWAFRKALVVGLFLVMNGNVVCLVRKITKTANIVGRTGKATVAVPIRFRFSSDIDKADEEKPCMPQEKETIFSIALCWIMPLFYTLTVFGWNCLDYSPCLPAHYTKKKSYSTENITYKCSDVWRPMAKGHLLLAVIIWTGLVVTIIVMLAFAIKKYYRASLKSASSSTTPLYNNQEIPIVDTNEAIVLNEVKSISITAAGSTEKNLNPANNAKFSRILLQPTMKLLIGLSVLYIVCTAPLMVCFAIDSLSNRANVVKGYVISISSILVCTQCFVGPGLMIAYMHGLRSALIRMLLRCDCTLTTSAK